jgi:hypothetical protein
MNILFLDEEQSQVIPALAKAMADASSKCAAAAEAEGNNEQRDHFLDRQKQYESLSDSLQHFNDVDDTAAYYFSTPLGRAYLTAAFVALRLRVGLGHAWNKYVKPEFEAREAT